MSQFEIIFSETGSSFYVGASSPYIDRKRLNVLISERTNIPPGNQILITGDGFVPRSSRKLESMPKLYLFTKGKFLREYEIPQNERSYGENEDARRYKDQILQQENALMAAVQNYEAQRELHTKRFEKFQPYFLDVVRKYEKILAGLDKDIEIIKNKKLENVEELFGGRKSLIEICHSEEIIKKLRDTRRKKLHRFMESFKKRLIILENVKTRKVEFLHLPKLRENAEVKEHWQENVNLLRLKFKRLKELNNNLSNLYLFEGSFRDHMYYFDPIEVIHNYPKFYDLCMVELERRNNYLLKLEKIMHTEKIKRDKFFEFLKNEMRIGKQNIFYVFPILKYDVGQINTEKLNLLKKIKNCAENLKTFESCMGFGCEPRSGPDDGFRTRSISVPVLSKFQEQKYKKRINELELKLGLYERNKKESVDEYTKKIRLQKENEKAIEKLKTTHEEQMKNMKSTIVLENDKKVEEKEKEIEDLRTEYEEKINEMKSTLLDEKKKGIEELENKLADEIEKLKTTTTEKEELKKTHSRQIEKLKSEKKTEKETAIKEMENTHAAEIQKLKSTTIQKDKTIEQLKSTHEEELKKMNAKLSSEDVKVALEKELETLKTEHLEERNRLSKKVEETEKERGIMESMFEKQENLIQTKIETMKKKNDEITSDMKTKHAKEMEKITSDMKARHAKEMEEIRMKLQSTGDIEDYKKKTESLKEKLRALKVRTSALFSKDNDPKKLKEEIEKKTKTIESLENQREEERSKLDGSKKKITQLQRKMQNQKSTIRQLERKLQEQKSVVNQSTRIKELEKQVKEYEHLQEVVRVTGAENQRMHSRTNILEMSMTQHDQSLTQKEKEIITLQEKVRRMDGEIDVWKKSLEQQELMKRRMEDQKVAIELETKQYQTKLKETEGKRDEIQKMLQETRVALSHEQKHRETVVQQNTIFETKVDILTKKFEKSEEEIKKLQDEIGKTKYTEAELRQKLLSQEDQLNETIKNSRVFINVNSELRKTLEEMRLRNASLLQKVEQTEATVEFFKNLAGK